MSRMPVSSSRSARRSAPTRRSTQLLDVDGVPIELVRSTARRKTISASWRQGRLRVLMPAGLGRGEERAWIRTMIAKAPPAASRSGAEAVGADGAGPRGQGPLPAADVSARPDAQEQAELSRRAEQLRARHLPEAPAPSAVVYSTRQRHRWGSCTPETRRIRISAQLAPMPGWVRDAVLVHELAHLIEPGHGRAFRRLVDRFPRYGEAMAFLDGVTYATGRGLQAHQVPEPDTPERSPDDAPR